MRIATSLDAEYLYDNNIKYMARNRNGTWMGYQTIPWVDEEREKWGSDGPSFLLLKVVTRPIETWSHEYYEITIEDAKAA